MVVYVVWNNRYLSFKPHIQGTPERGETKALIIIKPGLT